MHSTTFLRVEGLAVALAAFLAYAVLDASWLLLALLVLAPDLSMAGYLRNPRVGAWTYNLGHLLVWPLALLGWGTWAGVGLAQAVGLIWLVHVGADRALGYGLKEPAGFSATHLGRIGGDAAEDGPAAP